MDYIGRLAPRGLKENLSLLQIIFNLIQCSNQQAFVLQSFFIQRALDLYRVCNCPIFTLLTIHDFIIRLFLIGSNSIREIIATFCSILSA
ncbi:hypothetical protein FGO68_gene512 [Halteria grandinella]|uniref:Uncharacterized protein n=1 Tax=Halteria grandinella TaxID=5974 RepID=A0A8J8P5K2_HALGN|nr:hypothetical protein FGO68_gene512 [Halteria grandinella]